MERNITHTLAGWKSRNDRKPLIIRGARQVGKTYSIDAFARSNFQNYIKINFEEQLNMRTLFQELSVTQLVDELPVYFDQKIIPGETLLFLDEIQTCPQAIVKLRYFYEHFPELHVISAGSLLDFALNEINMSMPVGRVEFLYMYPMNFEEFLKALEQQTLANAIKEFSFEKPFSRVLHQKILEFLRLFLFIGGMPEAIKSYIEENQFLSVERVHNNIVTTLQFDFSKYGTKKQQEHITEVFKYCPGNISRKVKYSNINKHIRSAAFKEAFHRLELSRILHIIRHTNARNIPITSFVNEDIFKPLFLDIGLANHLNGIQLVNIENIFTNNEGAIAEQFIGQELLTTQKSFIDAQLYYWTRQARSSNAEIDYVYQHENAIFPIEVKAGKSGSLKSLHLYLFEKQLETGIRFNMDMPSIGKFTTQVNSGKNKAELDFTLLSLPLYMCFNLPDIIKRVL